MTAVGRDAHQRYPCANVFCLCEGVTTAVRRRSLGIVAGSDWRWCAN
jgi:hypothetical protein